MKFSSACVKYRFYLYFVHLSNIGTYLYIKANIFCLSVNPLFILCLLNADRLVVKVTVVMMQQPNYLSSSFLVAAIIKNKFLKNQQRCGSLVFYSVTFQSFIRYASFHPPKRWMSTDLLKKKSPNIVNRSFLSSSSLSSDFLPLTSYSVLTLIFNLWTFPIICSI